MEAKKENRVWKGNGLSLWCIQVDILRESFGFIGLKCGSETPAGDLHLSRGV